MLLGQSHIVALAAGNHIFNLALVSPSSRTPSGYIVESSTSLKGTASLSGKLTIGCVNFVGLWFIFGAVNDLQANLVRIRLQDGTVEEVRIHANGFLTTKELDPTPFEVFILRRDGIVLEQLQFPPGFR